MDYLSQIAVRCHVILDAQQPLNRLVSKRRIHHYNHSSNR